MNDRRARFIFSLAGLVAALGFSGCAADKLPPLYPVGGTVTVDGEPLTSGSVSFFPQDLDALALPPGKVPTAQINDAGEYHLMTVGKAGAPLATYKVTVQVNTMPTPDAKPAKFGRPPARPFNVKYSDLKTTPLTIQVAESGSFNLKLTKK